MLKYSLKVALTLSCSAQTGFCKLARDSFRKAQEKITKLQKLDPLRVEPLLQVFFSSGCLYLVNKFIDQGWNDLYRLANIRTTFSEADIGSIGMQLLDQLSHLHDTGIVYKYLRP